MAVVKVVELDITVTGDADAKAKLDAIDARAAALKKAFPSYTVKVDTASAMARLAVFRAQLKDVADSAGKPAQVQVLTDKAMAKLVALRATAEDLKAKFPEFTVSIDDKAARAELALFAADAKRATDQIDKDIAKASGAGGGGIISKIGGLFGGGGGSAGAAGGAAGGGAKAGPALAEPLSNPYVLAGAAAAALAALPFVAQAAAGAITFTLGAALAGIGIAGVQGTAKVQKAFTNLSTHASADLKVISASFIPVMTSVYNTATSVLGKMTPVFAGAEKTISGPFQLFADTLLKTFGSPAVQASIKAVATAFGGLLKALAPSLAGDVNDIASGITKVADAVAKNPDAFRNFISFLAAITGGALTVIAALTRFASYVETHFVPGIEDAFGNMRQWLYDDFILKVTGFFDTTLPDSLIRSVNAVRNDFVNPSETAFGNMRQWIYTDFILKIGDYFTVTIPGYWHTFEAGVTTAFNTVKASITTAWNTIWTDTKNAVTSGISAVVNFFTALPGKVTSALSSLGPALEKIGSGALTDFLNGVKSIASTVTGWFTGFAGDIISVVKKILGVFSPSSVFYDIGKNLMAGLKNGILDGLAPVKKAAAQAASTVSGTAETGLISVAAYLLQHGATKAAAAGIAGVIAGESGGNPEIYQNPSNPEQGGGGLLQWTPPSSAFPYQPIITGNAAKDMAVQLADMMAYIGSRGGLASINVAGQSGGPMAAAQVFSRMEAPLVPGSDIDAAAVQSLYAQGYDKGGWLPPGLTLALNATGRPEMILPPRAGGGGSGQDRLVAELRALRAEVQNLTGVAAAIPVRTGQHVAAGVNGAAASASFRARYPGSR